MTKLFEEILEIPEKAKLCYEKNKTTKKLPKDVYYLGMGSSYFAPLTLYFSGAPIKTEIAAEYYSFKKGKEPLGILISQSGESSETIWNAEKFDEFIAVTNNSDSSLAKAAREVYEIFSGKENFSSTKSYINTLIILYLGLGFEPFLAIEELNKNFKNYQESAQDNAQKIFNYIQKNKNGLYILGSGPNIATAYESALTLTETTKIAWTGMSLAQFDHGPKEASADSVIIILNASEKDKQRSDLLKHTLNDLSNCLIIELDEENIEQIFSPITLITRLNLIMADLAKLLKIEETFQIGDKITTIPQQLK